VSYPNFNTKLFIPSPLPDIVSRPRLSPISEALSLTSRLCTSCWQGSGISICHWFRSTRL